MSANKHWHGQDGSDWVQRGDEDADLTNGGGQQQSPGGFSVSFPVTKHLRDTLRVSGSTKVTFTSVCIRLPTCKKGTMPSRAIAWSRRGAPVRLCRPAPQQEKKEPITITQGEGQESVPMTRFPFTESPNLQCTSKHLTDGYCHENDFLQVVKIFFSPQ